jgi:hypothetical protein
LDFLASVFVNQPLHVLLLAMVYLVGWLALRLAGVPAGRKPSALLVPAVFAFLYAGWEWLVTTRTPEADIRVDLLVIWPVLFILTVWAVVRVFRK